MALHILPIVLAVILTGCTHSRTVHLGGEMEGPYAAINEKTQRKKPLITLADRRLIKASDLQLTPDSSSWLNVSTKRFETVATSEIRSIRFVKRGQGVLEGLSLGLLVGASLGGALGYATSSDSDFLLGRGVGALFGGVLFGGLGASIGIVMGVGEGSKVVFHFQASPPVQPGSSEEPGQ